MSHRSFAILASTVLLGAAFSTSMMRAQEGPPTPRGMDALAASATLHTDLKFDESMLRAASQIMPDEDKPIIAKLRSITVHQFRYSAAGMYDPAAPVKPFDPTRTDVWVRMDHANFDGMVVLVANERNVNLIVIDGMISATDLLHLRGHFGIPRFGGDLEGRQ